MTRGDHSKKINGKTISEVLDIYLMELQDPESKPEVLCKYKTWLLEFLR